MKNWSALLSTIVGFFISLSVTAAVTIEPYKTGEFNPTSGQIFVFSVTTDQPGKIALSIYSTDGDIVRTLSTDKNNSPAAAPSFGMAETTIT